MKTVYILSLVAIFSTALACGYGSKNYSNTAPLPTISQLSPDNTNAGGSAFALTVNGNNFNSTAIVNWNGVAQSTTFVSGNQLVVAIPASMITAPATAQITVTNPASGKGPYGMRGTLAETSMPVNFTIN